MKYTLAKIYVAEIKVHTYYVYIATHKKFYELGVVDYFKCSDLWMDDGDNKRSDEVVYKLAGKIANYMLPMADTVVDLTYYGMERAEIWDMRGDSTICAVTIELETSETRSDIYITGTYKSSPYWVATDKYMDQGDIVTELREQSVAHWAADYTISAIRRFGAVLKEQLAAREKTWRQELESDKGEEQEAENDREN